MPNQLDLNKTYRAILDAARDKRFISYGELAEANDAEWKQVHFEMNSHLGELVRIAADKNWPMLSAIVVNKQNVTSGRLDGSAREGFINAAREFDFDVSDPADFVKEQQQATFAWAEHAPDELLIPKEDDDLFADPNRQFWFVGAMWGHEDQTQRFIDSGIWENGHEKRFADQVALVQAGDRIAIKSVSTRNDHLPFDSHGERVSFLRVKAVGTVITPTTDGKTIEVDWQHLAEPKDWYIYTGKYRTAIAKADAQNNNDRQLIRFAFTDHDQDLEFWLRYRSQRPEPKEVKHLPSYGVDDILQDGCFLSRESLESALAHLTAKRNLVLQGPPGTGKTWLAKRLGYALIGTKDLSAVRNRIRSIQFHPSLSYEDFVRGWRPDGDGKLSLIDGVFLEAVATAHQAKKPCVVVIDEINRGNPAQIFGEMLTLLERDKRSKEDAIELAYRRRGGETIFVPDDLFVIGTMNIADRSLALVDLALRRRFAFVTLEPVFNERWREWCSTQGGINDVILKRIRSRMIELNDEIASDRTLGAQFKVGHSYVTPGPRERIDDSRAWFRSIVESEIAPLLEEYWFDNLDKAAKAKKQLLRDL